MSSFAEEKNHLEKNIEDRNIVEMNRLVKPHILKSELPITDSIENFVIKSRQTIENIINGTLIKNSNLIIILEI